ncbi:hypothetical protein EYF80_034828 [Liparis tanakae]|uniref:Uncharacterized protein n=1 Tax=Liparis tanakae TaxID=230148 RepID=A0A4Z2GP09_9TELE|nr:hypothetical protein EYF80_034828 [Liparis tanakae]
MGMGLGCLHHRERPADRLRAKADATAPPAGSRPQQAYTPPNTQRKARLSVRLDSNLPERSLHPNIRTAGWRASAPRVTVGGQNKVIAAH